MTNVDRAVELQNKINSMLDVYDQVDDETLLEYNRLLDSLSFAEEKEFYSRI